MHELTRCTENTSNHWLKNCDIIYPWSWLVKVRLFDIVQFYRCVLREVNIQYLRRSAWLYVRVNSVEHKMYAVLIKRRRGKQEPRRTPSCIMTEIANGYSDYVVKLSIFIVDIIESWWHGVWYCFLSYQFDLSIKQLQGNYTSNYKSSHRGFLK